MQKENMKENLPVIGASLRFISADEVKQLLALQSDHKTLADQLLSVCSDVLRQRVNRAREAYGAQPTAENLSTFIRVTMECTFLDRDSNVMNEVRLAVARFNSEKVFPFVQTILTRGLALASSTAETVTQAENERALQLIGRTLSNSDIIDAAHRPLRELESVLGIMSHDELNVPGAFGTQELLARLIEDHSLVTSE